jgi:uncharacterized protein
MISAELVRAILEGYRLPWDGFHGVTHWARVLENGLRLAAVTGARVRVVELFAVFHDARRISEDSDPGHGRRGADLAASLRGRLFDLNDEEFALLEVACADHTEGLTEGDITVQTCWDADRLDLGRVGITPHPAYLCTDCGKADEVIRWADDRACRGVIPEFVEAGWGLAEVCQLRRRWRDAARSGKVPSSVWRWLRG